MQIIWTLFFSLLCISIPYMYTLWSLEIGKWNMNQPGEASFTETRKQEVWLFVPQCQSIIGGSEDLTFLERQLQSAMSTMSNP